MTVSFYLRTAVFSALCIPVMLAPVSAQVYAKKQPHRIQKVQTDSVAANLQYKLDSHLLEALALYRSNSQAAIKKLALSGVNADSTGNLLVDISATITDSLLALITALGGKIIYPSKEYRTVRAIVNMAVVETIAGRKDVSFIQPAVQAHNNAAPQSRLQPHSN